MPQVKPDIETFANIKVIGVGGSGGSAVNRMVQSGIRGVDFMALNTDVQALHHNSAKKRIHIGKTITRGLGAGMDPEVGKRSAEETQNDIRESLAGTDMVFITCGLGGGTGSGASPVVAQIARDMGILTVAVVTKPFSFEGPQRMAIAAAAHEELARHVDTIITIPNDRVLQIIDKRTSLIDAFQIVDDVLRQGVQGISELITVPGLINVDFADVRTIMSNKGSALMGIGVASGDNRAVDAAKAAISSPLLEVSVEGARGILFSITGGSNLGMQEVAEAAQLITASADSNAKVIFGAVIDESMGDDIRITVIATGFEDGERFTPPAREQSRESDLSEVKKKPFYSSTLFTKKKPSSQPEPTVVSSRPSVSSDEAEQDDPDDDMDAPEPVSSIQKESFSSPSFSKKSVAPPVTPSFERRSLAPVPSLQSDMSSSVVTPPPIASPAPVSPEDDVEIPAFIRKKMGM